MHNVKPTSNDAAAIRGKHDAKSELRKRLRSLRASIPTSEKETADATICKRLLETRAYRESNVILTYLSVKDEVDTHGIIECAMASGKHVALPRCVPRTREMKWHRVSSLDGLVVNAFGIEEPDDDDETLIDPAALPRSIAIVPALAFDEAGFRIGYGGGFYDVFLERFPGATIGLCRESNLHASLSAAGALEAHDRAVDLVVTEARVIVPAASGRERRVADK